MINKEKTISKILKIGLKEYKTSNLEMYDRAWQKKIRDELFINIHLYEFSKTNPEYKDSFEIEVYQNNNDGAEKILIYGFSNLEKAYGRAERYIKFLKEL